MAGTMRRLHPAATLLGVALVVAGCSAVSSVTDATPVSTEATGAPGGSTPSPADGATEVCDLGVCLAVTRDVPMSSATTVDVYAPTAAGSWPTVVFLHGDPPSHYPLVEDVARQGAVVFDARWRPPSPGTGKPELSDALLTSFEDAACAVSFASGRAKEYGGDGTRLIVAGHSAGGPVAMVAALTGNTLLEADRYSGDCAYDVMLDGPQTVVGLAGSYDPSDTPGDPRNALQESDPDLYRLTNPVTHLGSNPGLKVWLLHGRTDSVIPVESSTRFDTALREAGYDVTLTVLEDVGHFLTSPEPPNLPDVYDTVIQAILDAAG